MFITIVYVLSDQPMDLERFIWFSALGIAVGLTSQGLGYLIGSVFSITVSISAFSIKKRYTNKTAIVTWEELFKKKLQYLKVLINVYLLS